jgi:hypothetical protein
MNKLGWTKDAIAEALTCKLRWQQVLMDTYSETLKTIYNLRGGMIDLRLDRMSQALALFNHPENPVSVRVLHRSLHFAPSRLVYGAHPRRR